MDEGNDKGALLRYRIQEIILAALSIIVSHKKHSSSDGFRSQRQRQLKAPSGLRDAPAGRVAALVAEGWRHQEEGRLSAVEPFYREALRIAPNDSGALFALALLHMAAGRLRDAQRPLERLVRTQPDEGRIHFALGTLYGQQGSTTKSLFHLSRALSLTPEAIDAYLALIAAHGDAGRLDSARTIAAKAELQFAGRFEIPMQLGVACMASGALGDAGNLLETAAERAPHSPLPIYNLAILADRQREVERAMTFYRRAHDLDPDFEPAAFNLGDMELRTGLVAEAIARFQGLAARAPADLAVASARLTAAQYEPGTTAARLAELHQSWDRAVGVVEMPRREHRATAHRGLRIGLVSADLAEHPVGYFVIRAVEAFDPASVTFIAYTGRDTDDPICRRFKAAVRVWRNVASLDDAAVAKLIADDAIDILFDLSGHTLQNRLAVFAYRPAPVQISWAGYVGTTGLRTMDGLIADRFQVPEGEDSRYVEQVIRLPDGYVTFDPPTDAPAVTPPPAGATAPLTFASFHHPPKINRPVADLWARILRDLPGSSIRFIYAGYDVPEVQARIRGWFAEAGISGERLRFHGRMPRQELLRQYCETDLALDPFPYSGGLTTCEALWMGVPVVTLPGKTFAGRHSFSHLSVVGLTQTIAADLDDYAGIVRRLNDDRPFLSAMRLRLRAQVAASPLCDGPRFARNLEAALRDIWHRRKPGDARPR